MNTLQQEQLKLLNGLADDMPIEMNAGQLRALLATARAEGAVELERITKEVDSNHKALYKELEGTFCDRYSTDYKHGILRGYTLIGRMLHSNEAITTKEIDHAE